MHVGRSDSSKVCHPDEIQNQSEVLSQTVFSEELLQVACNSSTPSGVDFCLHAKENLKVGNFSFKEGTIEKCSVVSVSEDKEWGEQVRLFEPDSKVKMFVSTLELIVDGKPMKRVLTAEVLDKDVNVRSNKEVKQ